MKPSTHNLLWEPYIEAARDAWWQGDYEKAADILIRALKEAEDYGTVDPCLIRSVENLAQIFLNRRKFAQAEWLQMQAFEIQEKLLGPDHPDVARCFDKVASIVEQWESSDSHAEVRSLSRERDDWAILVVDENSTAALNSPVLTLPDRSACQQWTRFAPACQDVANGS